MSGEGLTHVDALGVARMVDVGGKETTERRARAGARIWMAPSTMEVLEHQALPKGDVLAVARIAGIMAAKRTAELIPLCHPLPLTHIEVEFTVVPAESRIDVECTTRTSARTGVEMEALIGAAMAAITVYDMCKAVDRGMVVGDLRLLEKTGGKEDYARAADAEPLPSLVELTGLRESMGIVSPCGASVLNVNISETKGARKKSVSKVFLRRDHGIEGDAHAGPWHRQVSLLAQESIDKMRAKGLDVGPGDFAENVTTNGLEVARLPIHTLLEMGEALVEVTQIGKTCHSRCAIYEQAGDCVMPREGIFVRVLSEGWVGPGDPITVRAWGLGE